MWSKLIDVITLTDRQADVRRIEPAAKTHFQHGRIRLSLDEVHERHRGRDFEIRRPAGRVAVGRGFVIHRPHDRDQSIHQRDQLVGRARLAIDRKPLLDSLQMRRAEHARCDSRRP